MMNETKCGYIGIVGRPNVGKSTLLNRLLDEKLSITSKKPQTTRHQIIGIKTTDCAQLVFVDTPGIHSNAKKALNHYMNRAADSILDDVNVVLMLIESTKWTDIEEMLFTRLESINKPVIIVINKTDLLKDKTAILPIIQKLSKRNDRFKIMPVSSTKGQGIEQLTHELIDLLPVNEFFYDPELLTDRSERFLVSELIREKLIRHLGEELPHQLTVVIEQFDFDEQKHIYDISATILVERPQQKAIIIGKKGSKLKTIGSSARIELEAFMDSKVYLQLWVKVKEGWSDSATSLRNLGYS